MRGGRGEPVQMDKSYLVLTLLSFLLPPSSSRSWDPVTGLGTPNYEKLRAAAINA